MEFIISTDQLTTLLTILGIIVGLLAVVVSMIALAQRAQQHEENSMRKY